MILVVDDDPAFAENCSMLLESYGYEANVAFSGTEALSKINSSKLDLLICDCCMPDLTGLELSRQLNAAPGGAQFPILLMSGSLQRDVAPGNSYDAFIKKPFVAKDLLSEVQKLLDVDGLSPPENAKKFL